MSMRTDPSICQGQDRHVTLVKRLTHALSHKGLQVAYQPEFDLQTRQLVALEALCRWRDEELGQVQPDEFIKVAEAHGLIGRLGEYVLNQTLADLPVVLGRWPHARVAINISGAELAQEDFALRAHSVIQLVDPDLVRHLEVEVTESISNCALPNMLRNLETFRASEMTVAIDDFGTGQSNLARLFQLPFDKIKLDRAFVEGIENPMAAAIVSALVTLTQSFSRTLVVEGVETPAQLSQIIRLGCNFAQGYLLCRPTLLGELPDTMPWPL